MRLITMSSYVEKILERMINERMAWLAEKENWFDNDQNGFRKGKSCIDNLVDMISEIKINRDMNLNTVAAFLDVKSVYDNVRTDLMTDILVEKKCPSKITNYIDTWMRNRKNHSKFIIQEDKEESRVVNKGLPQGGVLSSTLYNIYTSEITKNIGKKVRVVQYTDDIALYVTEKGLKDCKREIEKTVNKIEERLCNLGLDIELTKSNIIVFNNKKEKRKNTLICRIKGERSGNVRSAKFLGIIIDSKLKFDKQMHPVQNKVDKAINIVRFLCRISWGMEVSTALMIYKSYIRSIIEYGLFIYYPREGKGREKMEKMQNKGIISPMGYRNSTPLNVMTVEAKILIEDRAGLLARNYWTKVVGYNQKRMEAKMNRMEILSRRKGNAIPKGSNFLMVESWMKLQIKQGRS